MKRPEHTLDGLVKAEIRRVRRGNVIAAQKMMRQCADNLREILNGGGNNLHSLHAIYLSQVLRRLADSEDTARLFCLGMPKHRPTKGADDAGIHLDRSRKVMAKYQHGGTLEAAMQAVADREHKSIGAIRASWKAKGFVAEIERLIATPAKDRGKIRMPGKAMAEPGAQHKGRT